MLSLRNLIRSYGDRRVLDVDRLEVPTGATHALVGQSGCGKSTLLRIVMGLLPPDSGEVAIDGQPVTAAGAPHRQIKLRHRIGYVIQDGGLFPHLTAEQNVTLVARQLRWDPYRIDERLAELAALVHFPSDGLARYPLQLSGGQRQRVGLMRALMLDPPLLLMDEPLGALDPLIRARLQADLKEIFQRLGKTVLLVTHDLGEAAFLAGTISVMRDGRILQSGTLRELRDHPADPYVTEFISAHRTAWPE